MKKFAVSLFSLLICLMGGFIFAACQVQVVDAYFSQAEIVLEMGKEYDPLDYVEDLSLQEKSLIKFETQDSSVAYITGNGKLVAVDYGQTTLYINFSGSQIASTTISVPKPPIQLSSPTNLHYDQNISALTWNYSLYELDGVVYPWHSYTLELKKGNGEWESFDINQKNSFAISDASSYQARILAKSQNDGFISSPLSGIVSFNLMAAPQNLAYNVETNTLVWDPNGNPSTTRYEVKYSFNNEELKSASVTSNQFALPEALTAGNYSFQVITVPMDNTYFKNQSDVFYLEKLSAPVLTFNNGEVSWQGLNGAGEYLVEVFNGEELIANEIVYASIGTKSNLPRTACTAVGANYSVCVTAISNNSTNIVSSDKSQEYAFEKLPIAEVLYNQNSKTFQITNAGGYGSMIEIKNTSAGVLTGVNAVIFNSTSSLPYNIRAKLFAVNSSQQIDGELASTFKIDGSDNVYTTIQNLASFSARYEEKNNIGFIKFTEVETDCSYKLFQNNGVLDISSQDNTFNLGQTTLLFADKQTHTFEILCTKVPQNQTVYVDTITKIGVTKLAAPTTLTLENNYKLAITDVIPQGVQNIEFVVNAEKTNALNLNQSDFSISAKYIAQDFSILINKDGESIDMFYSSSSATMFSIKRVEKVTGLMYDYSTSTFYFDKVSNATNYDVKINGKPVTQDENGNYVIEEVGEISVKALPKAWQPITSGIIGYLESVESTLNTYKIDDITSLKLQKEENGAVTAIWIPPKETYGKDLTYSVFVQFNNQNFVLEQNNITECSYTFDVSRFDAVGEYTIKVQIQSASQDFFVTETDRYVIVTRLAAPTEITRIDQSQVLKIEGFDDTKMSEIYFVEDIDGEVKKFTQSQPQYTINLKDGQTLKLKVSFVGAFSNNKYNLGSLESSYTIVKFNKIHSASLNSVDNRNCSFSWISTEEYLSGSKPMNMMYEYYNTFVSGDSTTNYCKDPSIVITNQTGEYFTFHVRPVLNTSNWEKINVGGTVYLPADEYYDVEVFQEQKVYDTQVDVVNNNVVVSFKYNQISNLQYSPYINLIHIKKRGNIETSYTLTGLSSTIITQSAYTTRQDEEGFYEWIFALSLFADVGSYSVEITASSTKTLKSEKTTLRITKLSSVPNLQISGLTGTFMYGSESLDMTGTKQLVVSGSINEVDGVCINLSSIPSGQTNKVTVYRQGLMDDQNLQYYLDSDPATFQFTRVQSKEIQTDFIKQELYWAITEGLPDGVEYEFGVEGGGQLVLNTNSISLSSSELLSLISKAGESMVKVKTIVPEHTISAFTDANSDMGYITSEFGPGFKVEKLGKVEGVKVESTQEGVKLSWQAAENAETYNIYLSSTETSKGISVVSTTETQIICGDWFSATTSFLRVEAVASGKITGDISSSVQVAVLNPITKLSITTNGVLRWSNNIDSQVLPVGDILIEVCDADLQSQFSVAIPCNQTTYNLLSNTSNLYLKNLLGGAFVINVSVCGSTNLDSTILSISSQKVSLTAQKLFAPNIEIVDNTVQVIDTNAQIAGKRYMLVIKAENEFIEYEYTTAVVIPQNLEGFNSYEISCYAISHTPNVINSNTIFTTKTRLSKPQNVKLSVDSSEKIVTVSWLAVESAEGYQIFVNNNLITTTSSQNTSFVFNESQFLSAGTYQVTVKAISSNNLYSLDSNSVTVVRLNAAQNAYVSNQAVVELGNAVQSVSNYAINLTLWYDNSTYIEADSGLLANTTLSYNGFQNKLEEYEGGSFMVVVSYLFSGEQSTNLLVLKSQEVTISAFKLYAPTINIMPNQALFTLNGDIMIGLNQNADEASTVYLEVKTNNNYALNDNNEEIKNLNTAQFVYPKNWESGVYEFSVIAVPTVNANVIKSNAYKQTTTRLDSPLNLAFTRQNADENNYFSDEELAFLSSTVTFSYSPNAIATGYTLYNGKNYYSASSALSQEPVLTTLTTFNCEFSSNFEAFLYGGTNKLEVVAIAPSGGEYINSKPAEISFDVLKGVDYIKSNGNSFDWYTTDLNFNGFLVMSIETESETFKFWQGKASQNTSKLDKLISEGKNFLNIKTLGNISSTPISENVVLDSLFMPSNQQFTKLAKIQNIGTQQGLFIFNKILDATEYYVIVYDGENVVLETKLENYQAKFNLENTADKFIGYSTKFTENLESAKPYTLKIQAKHISDNYLFSDLSQSIKFEVLSNPNQSTPLKLVLSAENHNQLDKKVINVGVDQNAQGVWVFDNQILSTFSFNNKSQTNFAYMPIVTTSGSHTYTFYAYGSTTESQTATHYLLSSPSSLTLVAPEKPVIKLQNGVITWTDVSEIDGYYVYINGTLYEGKIYNQTSLDLPTDFKDNTRISIEVVPVAGGDNSLWGVKGSFMYIASIEEDKSSVENANIALKPHKPNQIQIENGALLYKDGIKSLETFNETDFDILYSAMRMSLNETSVSAYEKYIEALFTTPVTLYSNYTGFIDLLLDISLTDKTGLSYTYQTSGYKFIKLTETQLENLKTLAKKITDHIPAFIKELNVSPAQLYDFENVQNFKTKKEFYASRLQKIVDNFSSRNSALSALLNTNEQNRYPSTSVLFEEFENGQTAGLGFGTYTISIKQKGTNQDVLNSAFSASQQIYLPSAPQAVTVVCNDYNYYLVWNPVKIETGFTYLSNIGDEATSSVVYMLFAEGKEHERTLLCETTGTNYNGKLSLSLTSLIEQGILTPNFNKLYLVVKGNSVGDEASSMILMGKKSAVIDVTVLPETQPEIIQGVMHVENIFDKISLPETSKFGFELTGEDFTKETIIGEMWENTDGLNAGQTYSLNIRLIGLIPELTQTNNFVLSGKKFAFKIEKLLPMAVNINSYGVFEWTKVNNASGFVLTVNDRTPQVFEGENLVSYEAENTGFNNFKFQTLGSSTKVSSGENVYFLNSPVNNSDYGLDGVMLDEISRVFIEDGLIKWQPHTLDNATNQTTTFGYKLSFSNKQILYTTNLTSEECFKDENGNWCLDFTNYGQDGEYGLNIQAYIINKADKTPSTTINDKKTYTYLLGSKHNSAFEKIKAPQYINIENGEMVWTGNPEYTLFGYKFVAENQEITGTTTNSYIWDERLSPNTQYNFFVRAYQEGKVFSSYAAYANIHAENALLTATRLEFNNPSISKLNEANGNVIMFNIPVSAINFAINLRYKTNEADDYNMLKYGDANYDNIVSIIDNVVKINISTLAAGIESMQFQLQLVPIGNTEYLSSNFTREEFYVTPKPLSEVYFDEGAQEFFFEAQTRVIYNIKDEILNETGELVATYFYEVSSNGSENFYKKKRVNEQTINAICFAPTVVGFEHKISVAVKGDGSDFVSPYTICETTYLANLFTAKTDVFATLETLGTAGEAKEFFAQNAYGESGNPYLITSAKDFANINLRLEKYAYQNSYTVTINNASYEMFNHTESSNFVFSQTQDITGVETMIGIKQSSSFGSVKYLGFAGTYNGNGFTITYSLVSSSGEDAALFVLIEQSGVIQNLKVSASIQYNDARVVSGLAAENNGTIQNVTITNFTVTKTSFSNSSLSSLSVAGVVGINKGVIKNVINSASEVNFEVLANNLTIYAGGIAAQNEKTGTISQCGNNMNITVSARIEARVGGVVAQNNGKIIECYNNAEVSAVCSISTSSTYVAGIVGYNDTDGTIEYAYVKGAVVAKSTATNVFAGGVAGYTKNAQISFTYSAITQIAIKTDALGVPTEFGGTVCGYVDAKTALNNKNYYANEKAFARDGDEVMFNAEKVDVTSYNALPNLVNKINLDIGKTVFAFNGQDLIFSWENA